MKLTIEGFNTLMDGLDCLRIEVENSDKDKKIIKKKLKEIRLAEEELMALGTY